MFDLNKRVFNIFAEKNNDIIIRFDGKNFTDNNMQYITQLSEILANDELEIGSFSLDIFEIEIRKINTYEKDLINCER